LSQVLRIEVTHYFKTKDIAIDKSRKYATKAIYTMFYVLKAIGNLGIRGGRFNPATSNQ